MTLTPVVVLVVLLASTSAKHRGCGGLLEGENGKFDYSQEAKRDDQNWGKCVWLVQAYGATQIQFTLDEFLPVGSDETVILYPDRILGQIDLNPTSLNTLSVGSTLNFLGSTVIVILPQPNSSLSFSWDSTTPENLGRNDSVTIGDYVETPEGKRTWTPGRRQERLWWVIDASAEDLIFEWKTQVDESGCENCHPCTCLSFEAFQVVCDGYLEEVQRTCGRSYSGVFQMRASGPLVVAASANTTKRGESIVELRWGWGEATGSSLTTSTTKTTTILTTTTVTTAPPDIQASIYFTTRARGVSAFSLETNQTGKILNSTEYLLGITYDSIHNKLYWSTYYKIYRSNEDGTEVETVLNTDEYGSIRGLAFDWIGGNVYVATFNGFILACGAGAARTFSCYTILDGQGYVYGISMDPTEGLMYWTTYSGAGSIQRAGMDGSSLLTLVTGLNGPVHVTIDFASRRLWWTEYNGNKIQSSNLDGKDIKLVVQLPSNSYPWGIAIVGDRIYWGNSGNTKLQSSTKGGQDVQTLYTETYSILNLAVAPAVDQPRSRAKDCAKQNCTKLCVLSPTAYRCFD